MHVQTVFKYCFESDCNVFEYSNISSTDTECVCQYIIIKIRSYRHYYELQYETNHEIIIPNIVLKEISFNDFS